METLSFREQVEFYIYSDNSRIPRCNNKYSLYLKIMSYYPEIGLKIRKGISFLKETSLNKPSQIVEELLPIIKIEKTIKDDFDDTFSEWDLLLKDYLFSSIEEKPSNIKMKDFLIDELKYISDILDISFLRFKYFLISSPEKLKYKKSMILRLQNYFTIPESNIIFLLLDTKNNKTYSVEELISEHMQNGILNQEGLENKLKNYKKITCTNYKINNNIEYLLNISFTELKNDLDSKTLRISQCPNCGIYFFPHSKQKFCAKCQKISDDIKTQNPFQKIFRPIDKRANQRTKPKDKSNRTQWSIDGKNLRDRYVDDYKNKEITKEVLEKYEKELENLFQNIFNKGGDKNGKRNNKK